MKYREDKVDKDLRAWFVNDLTKALLRGASFLRRVRYAALITFH